MPEGHAIRGDDCDDEDADRSPSIEEICNDIDDDCDLEVDEGLAIEAFPDSDGDGFGLTDAAETVCEATAGFTRTPGDCDDDNADINPDAEEVCDEEDNNCDGETDEGLAIVVYPDSDEDGFGLTDAAETVCEITPGFTTVSGDCDDADATINPSAEEVCDAVDNDCDGATDDTPGSTPLEYWLDADGDGYGAGEVLTGCEMPAGYVSNDADCDDSNPDKAPDQDEVCDGIDNNCDGETDEALTIAVYPDADGDGFGRTDDVERRCEVGEGFSERSGDCDDTDASISPDGIEICNDKDDNCDDEVDNDATGGLVAYYADGDGDGHGTGEPEMACSSPAGSFA